MGIFEGEDETEASLGRVCDLNAAGPLDLALDPLRGAIGAILDEQGERVGTIVTDVATWWQREGLFHRRSVDPQETVSIEIEFDEIERDESGYETGRVTAQLARDERIDASLLHASEQRIRDAALVDGAVQRCLLEQRVGLGRLDTCDGAQRGGPNGANSWGHQGGQTRCFAARTAATAAEARR